MNTENMIDVTDLDLVKLVKNAYKLSSPVGLGFLHAKDGGLSDDEAKSIIEANSKCPVSMDYVHGRCCKFTVFADGDKRYIRNSWHDHSDDQLDRLISDSK